MPFVSAPRPFVQSKAVLFVHESGVIHRDIKPGNVMIRSERVAVLIDFGLAFNAGSYDAAKDPVVSGRCGTRGYMAPEVVSGLAYSAKVDVFSLGVVFREVLDKSFLANPSVRTIVFIVKRNLADRLLFQSPELTADLLLLLAGVSFIIDYTAAFSYS